MHKISFGDSLPGLELGEKSLPAIIVIQEWWGVSPNIVELATQIASHGFRVLIPDLYKGKIGVDAEEASHLMGALDFKAAVGEIKAAAHYLKSTGSPHVGITGFCMGGALTLAAMSEGSEFVAGAPFYGIPNAQYFDVTKIKAPILAQFGAKDSLKGFSDVAAAENLEEKIKSAGGQIEVHIYPSAGHGFMNALTSVGEEFLNRVKQPMPDMAEAELAMERLVKFFTTHLAFHLAPLAEGDEA